MASRKLKSHEVLGYDGRIHDTRKEYQRFNGEWVDLPSDRWTGTEDMDDVGFDARRQEAGVTVTEGTAPVANIRPVKQHALQPVPSDHKFTPASKATDQWSAEIKLERELAAERERLLAVAAHKASVRDQKVRESEQRR